MIRRVNIWTQIDWITIFIYLALVLIGWLSIYASVYDEKHQSIFDFDARYGKQMVWILCSFVLIAICLLIDIRFYTFFAGPLYLSTIILLLAVAFLGKEINGARSWFIIGPFQLQPTEFAKISTSLLLAKYLSSYNIKINSLKTIFIYIAIIFLPVGVIMLQPDFGSTLVYFSLILMLYREGLPGEILLAGVLLIAVLVLSFIFVASHHVILIIIAAVMLAGFFYQNKRLEVLVIGLFSYLSITLFGYILKWTFKIEFSHEVIALASIAASFIVMSLLFFMKKVQRVFKIIIFTSVLISVTYSVDYIYFHLLKPHQKDRVDSFFNQKGADPKSRDYNIIQSKIAIGSGGFWGKGFLQGTQTKFNFVPEQSTDFIFCTVGEEWGFLGTFIVIGLFAFLLLRLLFLAERQRSVYSRIYGYCVISILFFHIAINVGMTIQVLPVVGIPLPFFSYGGSSLWAFTVLLFIFLRFDASRKELLK